MKRKLKWLAIVLAVLLLGFGTALWLWPRDRITVESWKQIRLGMTEKEVENILGSPGKTEDEHNAELETLQDEKGRILFHGPYLSEGEEAPHNNKMNAKFWLGRRAFIEINIEGTVIGKSYWGGFQRDPTFIDRLRDWLGW
jgi:hypothetical protein